MRPVVQVNILKAVADDVHFGRLRQRIFVARAERLCRASVQTILCDAILRIFKFNVLSLQTG